MAVNNNHNIFCRFPQCIGLSIHDYSNEEINLKWLIMIYSSLHWEWIDRAVNIMLVYLQQSKKQSACLCACVYIQYSDIVQQY